MKTNKKQLLTALVLGVVMVILFAGGCKDEPLSTSPKFKPELAMSKVGWGSTDKVLRTSPGIKTWLKKKSIDRISPTLKGVGKITAELKEIGSRKKALRQGITVSSAGNFSATLNSTYYYCEADVPHSGPNDWYLINTDTWVYTYLGSTLGNYIDFYINKPSLYNNYKVYAEGPNGSEFLMMTI